MNLIRAVISGSVTVLNSAVKRRGKPHAKDGGLPDQKTKIIGADPNASKKHSSGARIIRVTGGPKTGENSTRNEKTWWGGL